MNNDDIGKDIRRMLWFLIMVGMTFAIILVSTIAYHYITEVYTIFQSVLFIIVAVAGGILSYGFAIYQYKKAK